MKAEKKEQVDGNQMHVFMSTETRAKFKTIAARKKMKQAEAMEWLVKCAYGRMFGKPGA